MSKIVSVNPRFQAALFKKTTAFASRVGGNTHMMSNTFAKGAPPPEPGPEIPQDAIFFAPLESDLKDYVNDIIGVLTRASIGTYERSGTWLTAAANQPRFGNTGLVMEGATTNRNTNYNNDPNTSLANVNANGATLSAVSDPSAISAAGLSGLVPAGYVFELDNQTAGPVTPTINGTMTASINTVSAWLNTFGSSIAFGFSGDGGTSAFSSTSLQRATRTAQLSTSGQLLAITLDPGERVRFILNQAVQSAAPHNPIITTGASSSVSTDALAFDVSGLLPFMPEGMASVYVTNKFPQPPVTIASWTYRSIIAQRGGATGILGLVTHGGTIPGELAAFTTANTGTTRVIGADWLAENKQGRVIGWWNPGNNQKQCSQTDNTDAWRDSVVGAGGAITEDGTISIFGVNLDWTFEVGKVALWNEDKGLQWIKDNA